VLLTDHEGTVISSYVAILSRSRGRSAWDGDTPIPDSMHSTCIL